VRATGGRACGGSGKERCRGSGVDGAGEGDEAARERDPPDVTVDGRSRLFALLEVVEAGRPSPMPPSTPCELLERARRVATDVRREKSAVGDSSGGEAGKRGGVLSVRESSSLSRRSGKKAVVGASRGGERGWSCDAGNAARGCERV